MFFYICSKYKIRKALLSGLSLVFVLLSFISCSKEFEMAPETDFVQFITDIEDSWNITRVNQKENYSVDSCALRNGSNLYLYSYVDNKIISENKITVDNKIDNDYSNSIETRASRKKRMYDSFGVSAFVYEGKWTGNETPNYMYNVKYINEGPYWNASPRYLWPGKKYNIKLVAYAPYNNKNYKLSSSSISGEQRLFCTVPKDVNEQKDLLVAKIATNGDVKKVPLLKFKHVLSAVRFVLGDEMSKGKIKSISINGVKNKGEYFTESNKWELDNKSLADYKLDLNKVVPSQPSDKEIIEEGQTLMMLPQKLPKGAYISMIFVDNVGETHKLKFNLEGKNWPQGVTTTYSISTTSLEWEYVMEVEANEYSYKGVEKGNLGLKCYKISKRDKKKILPVSWELLDEGQTYSWFAFTGKKSGSGSIVNYEKVPLKVDPQISIVTNYNTMLQEQSPKGTKSNPYNLSNKFGEAAVQNTANCYLVDAPGYYSLPLVYGNAIKHSCTNKKAYYYRNEKNKTLAFLFDYLNHLGEIVKDPYIYNNKGCGCNQIKEAKLIWQDASNLVTEVKLTGDKKNLRFKISSDDIQQGNAVLAIYDKQDRIMWSWHIWVTSCNLENTIDLDKEIVGKGVNRGEFMPVPIGWCTSSDIKIYKERKAFYNVKLDGKIVKPLVIRQKPKYFSGRNGNAPYYQWGRKDPFIACENCLKPNNKTWYDTNNCSQTKNPTVLQHEKEDTKLFATLIQNPEKFYPGKDMESGYLGHHLNLWNNGVLSVQHQDEDAIKTIYDPSPLGFVVGPLYAFQNIWDSRNAYEKSSNVDKSGVKYWDFRGEKINVDNVIRRDTLFVPLLGHRTENGLFLNNTSGKYWSSYVFDKNSGGNLGDYFCASVSWLLENEIKGTWGNENSWYPNPLGDACTIIPIKEVDYD